MAGSAQAQVESELARVQRVLVASEDARRKMESELDGVLWLLLERPGGRRRRKLSV